MALLYTQNKISHDIAEILLKLALNINQSQNMWTLIF